MAGDHAPQVGVVIVNWNRWRDTVRCIASVLASDHTDFRIVLVDNGSTDDSVSVIEHMYPHLTLLRNDHNLGFTGGYNTGIAYLLRDRTDYIFLINNDAVAEPETISSLVSVATAQPDSAFLGPKVLSLEEPRVILSAGGWLRDRWQPVHRGMGELDDGQLNDVTAVDYVSGCALLARREAVQTIGLLDERFFAYHEDVDWCYRARQAGFSVLYVPYTNVKHPDTRSRDRYSIFVTYYITRNSLLFAHKHRLSKAIALMMLGYLRLLLGWTLGADRKLRRGQRAALARALADFARGRFGPAHGL